MSQGVMSGMDFAAKVKLLLERYRMSQADLAEAVGTHQPQVSKWLNGGVMPSMPLALRVARALKVPLDFLMDDELEELPRPVELPQDEANVLNVYRSLKRTGSLDEDEAITGLASAAHPSKGAWPSGPNDAATSQTGRDPARESKPKRKGG